MINMLRADLYRLVRSKGLLIPFIIIMYVLTASLISVMPAYIGTTLTLSHESTESIRPDVVEEIYNEKSYAEIGDITLSDVRSLIIASGFKYDIAALGINVNLVYLILVIISITIINDYSHGCIKNTLSSNISRRKYYISKALFINIISLVLIVLYSAMIFLGNRIVNGAGVSAGAYDVLTSLLKQIPGYMAVVSLLIFEAYIIRRPVAYVITAILTPSIMSLLYQLGNSVKMFDFLAKYEPTTIMLKVLKEPSGAYLIKSSLVCAVIMMLCYTLSYKFFSKLDIK